MKERRIPQKKHARISRWRSVVVMIFLVSGGCSWSSSPEFPLNTEGRDPQSINSTQRGSIAKLLQQYFGTPNASKIPTGVELDQDLFDLAAGTVGSDENHRPRGLYRKHCMSCHGIGGEGAGPAAEALAPYPRDFRPGLFKFTSTAGGGKPVRADLLHTLQNGIPGTAMPSFVNLPEPHREALADYVRYLSLRGETELYLMQLVVDEDETFPTSDLVEDEGIAPLVRSWKAAESLVVVPPPEPPIDTPERLAASIARGRELYLSTGAQCSKCHGVSGRGDGEQSALFDDWNKKKQGMTPQQTEELARLYVLPLQGLRPRNFTQGIFHGGDRPIDVYRRIAVGIKGTPMPAAGPAPGSAGILSPEDIWHVVHYVRSLGIRP